MSNSAPPPLSSGSLASEIVEGASLVFCVAPDNLVISEDRLENTLLRYKDQLEAKDKWVAPGALALSLLLALTTSTFNTIVLKGETWHAIFIVGLIADIIWLVVVLTKRRKVIEIREIVSDLKRGGKARPMMPVKNAEQLPATGQSYPSTGMPKVINLVPQCSRCGNQLKQAIGQQICPLCGCIN